MEIMNSIYSIIVALIFNCMDLLTGIIAGLRMRDIQSSKLRDGLFKKVGFLFCYFLGWLVDTQGYRIGFNINNILPIIILYACTTELVSIIENIYKINPDISPDKLMSIFHIKKDK